MKISKAAVLAVIAACSYFPPSVVEGFVPSRKIVGQGWHTKKSLASIQSRDVQSLTVIPIDRLSKSRLWAAADNDDDDEDDDEYDSDEPLAKGVNSVSWLPTVIGAKSSGKEEKLTRADSEILPLFPLGGIVYTPNSEHILNIFEPRYREMYSDILMNGTKRFAVSMSHPTESGRFAQMAVLFELKDLKEVSAQTADQIKYICSHKVTGRVKLHRILNPEAWQSRKTYLRVEGTIMDDSGKVGEGEEDDSRDPEEYYAAEENPREQKLLRGAFADLVDIQHELEEDVRFTRASVASLALKPGPGPFGLWQTVRLWQSFADQRLMSRQNELQRDFQEKLQAFLKKDKGLKDDELPSAIGFQDLSPALQEEVKELQKRMAVELQPLVLESTLTMQKILECETHTDRLKLLRHFIEAETKRLTTKKAIKGMFASAGSTASVSSASSLSSSIPPEEQISEDSSSRSKKSSGSSSKGDSSIFLDDEDAFQ